MGSREQPVTTQRQSFRSRYVMEATPRLIISVGGTSPRESVKARLRDRVTWRIVKNGKRKEKRWSAFSDAVYGRNRRGQETSSSKA